MEAGWAGPTAPYWGCTVCVIELIYCGFHNLVVCAPASKIPKLDFFPLRIPFLPRFLQEKLWFAVQTAKLVILTSYLNATVKYTLLYIHP